jgi:hypothetical protein
LTPEYDSAQWWVAPAVQRGLINPGKRQISVPGGGSTLTHYQSKQHFSRDGRDARRFHKHRSYAEKTMLGWKSVPAIRVAMAIRSRWP